MRWIVGGIGLCSLLLLGSCDEHKRAKPRTVIATPNAPAAIGPYSQAIAAGRWIFCSGQIALDPKTGKMIQGSVEDETRRVLENLKAVLVASGATLDDVVRATVYLKDMADYKRVNAVYAEYFGKSKPARAAVQVAALPLNASIEISCIARKTD